MFCMSVLISLAILTLLRTLLYSISFACGTQGHNALLMLRNIATYHFCNHAIGLVSCFKQMRCQSCQLVAFKSSHNQVANEWFANQTLCVEQFTKGKNECDNNCSDIPIRAYVTFTSVSIRSKCCWQQTLCTPLRSSGWLVRSLTIIHK